MIKIYTFADKRPDFISKQLKSFNKFIDEKFEYFVFNNASNDVLYSTIKKECINHNIIMIDTIKDHSNPQNACYVPINYFFNTTNFDNEDISVIIDSDIFMIDYFNFSNYLKNHDIAAIYQQRKDREIEYLWNALIIFKNNKFNSNRLNFKPLEGITDVGGMTYNYVSNNFASIKWMKHTADIREEGNDIFNKDLNYLPKYGSQIIEKCFFHYYRGSNWDNANPKYHEEKTKFLDNLLHNAPIDLNNINAYIGEREHALKHWNGQHLQSGKHFFND